tara:strand:+ start:443 stop:1030 length:588 start_codon:yes stop_codon:yes gene_type:complete
MFETRKFTNQQKNYIKDNEINVIYEDSDWKVINPKSLRASVIYGFGTKWCTASDEGIGFDYHTRNGSLIYIINKKEQMDNPYYKVLAWKPKADKLPIKRGCTTGFPIEKGLIKRYKGLPEYEILSEHYIYSLDKKFVYKYTNDWEFYDSVQDQHIMPVQFIEDECLRSEDWELPWKVYVAFRDWEEYRNKGDIIG